MEPMELSCLVFENKELAIGASAKLLGKVLDKIHGFGGFISPSETRRIMNEGKELTYSSQNPTTDNVKVSYVLRELPWILRELPWILRELPWINLEVREGLENIALGVIRYSGLITIKNLNEALERDLLALREDFKKEYSVIDGIARPKELK